MLCISEARCQFVGQSVQNISWLQLGLCRVTFDAEVVAVTWPAVSKQKYSKASVFSVLGRWCVVCVCPHVCVHMYMCVCVKIQHRKQTVIKSYIHDGNVIRRHVCTPTHIISFSLALSHNLHTMHLRSERYNSDIGHKSLLYCSVLFLLTWHHWLWNIPQHLHFIYS